MSSGGNIAITGVPTTPAADGSYPLRREIRDLQRNFQDQFNLYILGLRHLQGLDQQTLESYYQISGIHGRPYKPWNGVGSANDTDWQTNGFGGYCTHSSILFIPWHRPYLALYEQALYRSVQAVAAQFPEGPLRTRYTTAAQNFRAPYFDWAALPPTGSSAFPSIIASPTIQVVDVDGRTKSISNPINRYTFHPINPSPGDFDANWSRYPTTVRHPNRITGQSQDSRIGPVLQNELSSLRSNVSLLLLSYRNFDAFSFNQWDPNTSPGAFGSLEDVHNALHDRLGGRGGHMGSLDVSSFDPVFWLHHLNVDRLWAIWQDLNPNSFMNPRPAPYSTWTVNGGDREDRNTPLKPFWNKSGTDFWTSDQVRSSTTFGHAYPETQRWRYASTSAYQSALRQTVTRLYGSNVFNNFVANVPTAPPASLAAASIRSLAAKPPPTPGPANAKPPAEASTTSSLRSLPLSTKKEAEPAAQKPLIDNPSPPAAASAIPDTLKHLAPDNKYTEWVVNIRAQKHGLGQSFRVQVFLGDIDESDPDSWDTEWNCVGRVSVLGRAPDTQCSKCANDTVEGLIVSGTVPLTSALLQDITEGQIPGLKPDDVVPHLKNNLKWKVTLFTGEEQDPTQVPDLRVSVASTEVTIGDDGLPDYTGVYTTHPAATEGKPAGLGDGDHI